MGDALIQFSHGSDSELGNSRFFSAAAVTLAVLTTASLTLLYWERGLEWKKGHRLPPGPRGWPVFGSLLAVGNLPHQTFNSWAKRYGPVMYLRLGYVRLLVVSSADMAREIFKTNDQIWASRPQHIIPTYMSYDAVDMGFSPYGSHWRNVRKVCALELFSPLRLAQFQNLRECEIEFTLRSILRASKQPGTVLNMRKILSDLTTNTITQTLWNKRYFVTEAGSTTVESNEFQTIVRETFILLGALNIADYIPVLEPISMNLMGLGKRMKDAHQKMDTFFDNVIEEQQKANAEGKSSKNFLDVLIKSMSMQPGESGSRAEPLSRDTVKGILWDVVLGATDTTAVTLEWALSELMRHPSIVMRAQDELESVVGPNRLVNEDDIPNLKYLQAVVKESLRLHPPGPLGLPRRSMEDCKIGGYHIPAGTQAFVNIQALQRDPSLWDRPLEFDPDRFLSSDIDVKGFDSQLVPFGAGRRMCPAMNLGVRMVQIILARMIHAFNWTLAGSDSDQPEKLDMSETFGINVPRAVPLTLFAAPRLADHIIDPSFNTSHA